jgi:hypothetical protein
MARKAMASPAAIRPTDRRPVMTPSPATTAAFKTCTTWTPPRREAAGEALPDNEAKAGVLGPEPGGEPDDPEEDDDDKPADDEDERDG